MKPQQKPYKKTGKGQPPPRRRMPRGLFFFLLFSMFVFFLLFYGYKSFNTNIGLITFGELQEQARAGKMKNILIKGDRAEGEYRKGEAQQYFRTTHILENDLDKETIDELRKLVGSHNFSSQEFNPWVQQLLVALIPWLLIIGLIWYFFFRQIKSSSGPGGIFSFGKSTARFVSRDQRKVTFVDVAGIDEAKDEVGEIIEFLKNPKRFQKMGARIPRGVVLVGPPGAGKTLLAKAIAGEANVPFLNMSGSDFVEMFVGVGASRVRDLFRQAKENSPCIIFLDEIDAVGRHRGSGMGGGHDEREQTLNAILVEMDGFTTDTGVIVVAATNRPDVLDPALLRPGRFDRQVSIDLPDVKGREAILKVHARRIKLAEKVDLATLAKTTPMFSGADLEAIINESALIAVMRKKEIVEMPELEEARDKVRWGREKRSRHMAEEDKKITAYHESGHALAAYLLPEVDNVHKVTIIPRGVFLGATMRLPEKDRYHMHKKYLLGNITVLFAGRVVEELLCNDISAGASSDIKEATKLARAMVCEWGMSEKLGPISYTDAEEHLFLGREITRTRTHSEAIAQEIDKEVHDILTACYQRARGLVETHKDACERIAQALLKREVLSATEIEKLFKGEELPDKTTNDKEQIVANDKDKDKEQNKACSSKQLQGLPDPPAGEVGTAQDKTKDASPGTKT